MPTKTTRGRGVPEVSSSLGALRRLQLHSLTLELLLKIVELFFLAELCALHLALLVVFTAWLAKHVIHELNGLRTEIRKWRMDGLSASPPAISKAGPQSSP